MLAVLCRAQLRAVLQTPWSFVAGRLIPRFALEETSLLLSCLKREGKLPIPSRCICASMQNDDKGPDLSVSFGVGLYPEDADTVESLMKAADSAMYAIKREKNQLRVVETPKVSS